MDSHHLQTFFMGRGFVTQIHLNLNSCQLWPLWTTSCLVHRRKQSLFFYLFPLNSIFLGIRLKFGAPSLQTLWRRWYVGKTLLFFPHPPSQLHLEHHPKPTEVKNVFPSTSTGLSSGSQHVHVSLFLPNAATPAQTQHVWRLLARTPCLFPAQLWATWPRASRLECWPLLGWMCVSFQSASISTLSMCSFSPDRCSPVPDASGAHLQLQAPLPPVMHT